MPHPMTLLNKREFVGVATSDMSGQPNAAPKMVLDVDKEFIYLVDYTIGKTWENLKANPRISLSFSDRDELKGYQINGRVHILENGDIPDAMIKKLDERKMNLSVERVISGVRQEKRHKFFEIEIDKRFVIYKVKVDTIIEIERQGELKRKSLPSTMKK